MKPFGLVKADKLCSNASIDALFCNPRVKFADNDCRAAIAFPIRAVWRTNHQRTTGNTLQFLISVPKKRLHDAVDRVKMRRRIREAFRLNRHKFNFSSDCCKDVAFIYIANDLKDYRAVEKSMCNLLSKISADEENSK